MRFGHTLFFCSAIVLLSNASVRGSDFNWDRGAGTNLWGDLNNWNPQLLLPNSADNIILSATSLSGAQTIDLAGTRSIRSVQANGVNGTYTFTNSVPGGSLDIFGLTDTSLLITWTPVGQLVFDTNIRYSQAGRIYINTDTDGGKMVFNAGRTLSSSASSGTTTINLTSSNTTIDYAIEMHSTIANGANTRVALEAGFAGDADAHIARIIVTGPNTYTGPTSVNGATLAFNSIADWGPSAAASALGAPTTLADATISLGTNAAAPNNVPGTLRYVGTNPAGHSSNRPFRFVGQSPGGNIESSGVGPLVLSGGVTHLLSSTVSQTLTLGGTNNGDNIFSGVIPDVPGTAVQQLQKTGSGKWILTGANTYLGGTFINAGTLVIGPGGAIGAGGTADVLSEQGAVLRMDGGAVTVKALEHSSDIDFRSGTITLTGPRPSVWEGQTSTLNIGTAGAGRLNVTGGTLLDEDIIINGPDDVLALTGGTATVFSVNNSAGGTFILTAPAVLNLDHPSRPPSGRLTTGAGTIGGVVSGPGGLTKVGAGTLEITSNNTYTGPTTVSQGTLRLASTGRIGDNSALTVSAQATYEMDGATDAVFSLNGAGTVNMLNNSLLIVGDGGGASFSGVIQGDGGFEKHGDGTQTVTGNNTYLGVTTVSDGVLVFNSIGDVGAPSSALGAPTTAVTGTIGLSSSSQIATLRYVGTDPGGHSTNRQIAIKGDTSTSVIEASGAGPLTILGGTQTDSNTATRILKLGGTNTGDNTFGGVIAGTGGLNVVKSGSGKWVLTAANTYAGSTTIDAGELVVRGGSIGGGAVNVVGTGTLTLDGGTITTPQLVVNSPGTFLHRSGTLTLGANAHNIAHDLAIGTNGPGAMTITASAASNSFRTLTIHGGDDSLTISGATNAVTGIDNSHGGTFNFTGGIISLSGGQLTAASGTLGGRITGTGGVRKIGPGTLDMAAGIANTYSGPTNIVAGTLRILGAGDQLSAATQVTVATGATLEIVGPEAEDFGALLGGGTVIVGALSRVSPGQDNQSTTFSGTVTGPGGLGKTGMGTLALEGTSNYTGDTGVTGGTLAVRGGGAITDTDRIFIFSSTLTLGHATTGPGSITAVDILNNNGTIDWVNGTLRIKSGAGIFLSANAPVANKPFGAIYELSEGRNLLIDATTTIGADGSLTLSGGQLKTGQLANTSGGTFDFQSGLLWFTQDQNFTEAFASQIDVATPLGAGRSVRVDGTATINAPITIAGGNFSATSIVNPHNLILDRGNLSISTALAIAPGTSVDASSGMQINLGGGLAVPATGAFNAIGTTLDAAGASVNDGQINAINSTLNFSGGLSGAGEINLINTSMSTGAAGIAGASIVSTGESTVAGRLLEGDLSISSGTFTFAAGSGGSGLAVLAVDEGAQLDLTNNSLVVEGTELSAITQQIRDGLIVSSAAGAGFRLGSISNDNGAGGAIYSTFMGIGGLDGDEVLIRYTRIGDLNLDGTVSISDFIDLASHFNMVGGATWQDGDVNYDGSVSISDFIDLAANFNTSVSGVATGWNGSDLEMVNDFAASIGAAAVPEPACCMSLALMGLLLTRRRGRGNCRLPV